MNNYMLVVRVWAAKQRCFNVSYVWSTLPDLSEKIMSWPHWEGVFEPQRKHSIRKYLELKKLSRNIGYYYSYSGEFMMFPTGKSWTCP